MGVRDAAHWGERASTCSSLQYPREGILRRPGGCGRWQRSFRPNRYNDDMFPAHFGKRAGIERESAPWPSGGRRAASTTDLAGVDGEPSELRSECTCHGIYIYTDFDGGVRTAGRCLMFDVPLTQVAKVERSLLTLCADESARAGVPRAQYIGGGASFGVSRRVGGGRRVH